MQDQTRTDAGDDLMDEVRAAIASLTAPWTVDQVARAVGADPQAVRGCVERLLDGGTIEDLGEDPRHEGDGPAPTLYGPPPIEESPEDKDVTLD